MKGFYRISLGMYAVSIVVALLFAIKNPYLLLLVGCCDGGRISVPAQNEQCDKRAIQLL